MTSVSTTRSTTVIVTLAEVIEVVDEDAFCELLAERITEGTEPEFHAEVREYALGAQRAGSAPGELSIAVIFTETRIT